jgi:hypothetical protein
MAVSSGVQRGSGASSPFRLNWEVRPPLTEPAGFGHLEVPQVAVVDGQPLLLFCTNPGSDPIWIVPGSSVTGPWDMALARPVHCPGLYAPRLVRDTPSAGLERGRLRRLWSLGGPRIGWLMGQGADLWIL